LKIETVSTKNRWKKRKITEYFPLIGFTLKPGNENLDKRHGKGIGVKSLFCFSYIYCDYQNHHHQQHYYYYYYYYYYHYY
jgi:hypothetical protein